MRYFRVVSLLAALSWTTSVAWAQYGLSGSPSLVTLPSAQAQPYVPRSGFAQPSVPYGVTPAGHMASAWDAEPAPAASTPFPQMLEPAYPAPDVPMHAAPGNRPGSKRQLSRPGGEPEMPRSVVEAMLADSSGDLPPPWGPDPAWGVEADCYDSCQPCFQPTWYVSARGLIMARGDHPNKVWTTYSTVAPEEQLMSTWRDMSWKGGLEVRFGRYFCCGDWALEAGYWTLDPFTSFDYQRPAGLVSTPLDFLNLGYADPGIAGDPSLLFDVADVHGVWRRDEVHNVELNVIRAPIGRPCAGPFSCSWTLGARFFRFEEDLLFGSTDQGGLEFGVDPTGAMEGYLDDKIINNLVGAQLGCRVDYARDQWRLFFFPKVGLYNNHIEHRFTGYDGAGNLFAPLWPGYPPFPVSSTRDVIAFLTEFDLGLEWRFHRNWSAEIGYRTTVATGMGLADHQFAFFMSDTPELADIDYNGYLILHGGFAGLTYRF